MTSQTQHTQQTQEAHEYAMYDQSFDASTTVARLVSTCNTERFKSIILTRREPNHVFTFGRHQTCDYHFASARFSNIHFRIWEVEQRTSPYAACNSVVMIEDTSTNGTFLNQARIGKGQRTVLTNGDELAAGIGVPADEARYVVQLPKQARPEMANLTAEAQACIEKYEIRDVLGTGGFATVRAAIDRNTGIKYAVKILNSQKLAISNLSTKATELFKREVSILQSTRHPNIVQYVDMWAAEEIFLVLEYLPGGDLMDYIMRKKRLDEYSTTRIVQQVLAALVYCHQLGIAHRDIKPENILLTRDEPPIVKLTDFGLAKMVEPGSFLKTFCGTLTYVAPEILSMSQGVQASYSTAVDMWSIGCVTFIMLTGSMPFTSDSQDAIMRDIQSANYDNDALEQVELSGPGMDFIEKLLLLRPEARLSGEQAIRHPWITETDRAFADDMDHDSQDYGSQEINRLGVAGDSHLAISGHYKAEVQSQAELPGTSGPAGHGLHDASSINWSLVDGGQGVHYPPEQRAAYLSGNMNSANHTRDPSSSRNMWHGSHFSADSSGVLVVGSSQYVSAASRIGPSDSNATITPQRLKQAQHMPADASAPLWGTQEGKENVSLARGKLYSSQPVGRRS